MFRISVNCGGPKYEYWVDSYEKALRLFERLNEVVKKIYTNDIIEDFYIEIIKER